MFWIHTIKFIFLIFSIRDKSDLSFLLDFYHALVWQDSWLTVYLSTRKGWISQEINSFFAPWHLHPPWQIYFVSQVIYFELPSQYYHPFSGQTCKQALIWSRIHGNLEPWDFPSRRIPWTLWLRCKEKLLLRVLVAREQELLLEKRNEHCEYVLDYCEHCHWV